MKPLTRFQAQLNGGIAVPREFLDYTVSVVEDTMPDGVTLIMKEV